MIRNKLLDEMSRVDERLSEITERLKGSLALKEKKEIAVERKKLEQYKKELLREWRHLNQ